MSTPEFDAWLATTVEPHAAKLFRSKLVGVSFLNDNGSSRQDALAGCHPREFLVLRFQPTNRYDPNAIEVLRQDGSQIGHLNKRLAGEITRSLERGEVWGAVIQHVSEHEHEKEHAVTFGATLVVFMAKPESAEHVRRRCTGLQSSAPPQLVVTPLQADETEHRTWWQRLFRH